MYVRNDSNEQLKYELLMARQSKSSGWPIKAVPSDEELAFQTQQAYNISWLSPASCDINIQPQVSRSEIFRGNESFLVYILQSSPFWGYEIHRSRYPNSVSFLFSVLCFLRARKIQLFCFLFATICCNLFFESMSVQNPNGLIHAYSRGLLGDPR
jgi:hypothetical protein